MCHLTSPSCHWAGNYKKCKKAQTFRFFVLIVARNIFQKRGGMMDTPCAKGLIVRRTGMRGLFAVSFCVGPFFISEMFHVKHSQAKHFFFIARNIFWQKTICFSQSGWKSISPRHYPLPRFAALLFLFLLIFGRFCFKNSQTVFSSPTPFCFYGKFCICKAFVADVLL